MKISLDPIDGKLVLQFAYRKELVDAIKELPDRRYNSETKEWTVGFDAGNLAGLLAMLAGNNWPSEELDKIELQCRQYLSDRPSEVQITAGEFAAKIKPPLVLMGELAIAAYLDGKITQAQQSEILNILNYISLKDFIHK